MIRWWHQCNSRRRQTIRCTGCEKEIMFWFEKWPQVSGPIHEADVRFPIVSIGEASQQGNWFVFSPGCRAMLPGSSGEFLRSCVKDPNAAKLEKHRGVYWLLRSATDHTDGTPLCPNPRTARLAVEAPPISGSDPDATPMQLEESEETRRPNPSTEHCQQT